MYLYMGRTIGFVTSNRKGGSGKFDIFSFEIETEEAVIAEVDNEESIAVIKGLISGIQSDRGSQSPVFHVAVYDVVYVVPVFI